jgi:hypothetical protein
MAQVPAGHRPPLPFLGELMPMHTRSEHPPGPLPFILFANAAETESKQMAKERATVVSINILKVNS